jgi:hypothetical protein
MKKITRIILVSLGLSLVTIVFAFLTSRPTPGQAGPPVASVKVTNTPLPVQGNVSASVAGTVNATQNGAWNVGVNNLPPTQNVSFNGAAQPVALSNTPFTPVYILDTEKDGTRPFEIVLQINPTNPGPGVTCFVGAGQCYATFDIPTPKRFVLEHVSAKVQGPVGMKYLAFLNLFLNITEPGVSSELGVFDYLEFNFQGTFAGLSAAPADVYTANQPVRAYVEETQPPPSVVIEPSGVVTADFSAVVSVSGYLIPACTPTVTC